MGNYVGNYTRDDVRKHKVRFVGTGMTPEIGIGNDVISSLVSHAFLDVVFHVLSYIVSYIVCKTFNIITYTIQVHKYYIYKCKKEVWKTMLGNYVRNYVVSYPNF